MKRFLSGLVNVILWVVCSVAVTVSVTSWIQVKNGVKQPMILGYGFAVVETGSMEPNVPTGSLVVIHKTNEYSVGDVITYEDYRGMSITHRVKSIENGIVVTQGDANESADMPFTEDVIVGKVEMVVPKLGSIIKVLKTPWVVTVLVGAVVIVIAWGFVARVFRKRKTQRVVSPDSINSESQCK